MLELRRLLQSPYPQRLDGLTAATGWYARPTGSVLLSVLNDILYGGAAGLEK